MDKSSIKILYYEFSFAEVTGVEVGGPWQAFTPSQVTIHNTYMQVERILASPISQKGYAKVTSYEQRHYDLASIKYSCCRDL